MTPEFIKLTTDAGYPVYIVLGHVRYVAKDGTSTYVDVGASGGAVRVLESVDDVLAAFRRCSSRAVIDRTQASTRPREEDF